MKLAQIDFDALQKSVGFEAGKEPTDIGTLISRLLNYAFTIAGIALLLYFLWGGFTLFTSGGDQKKVAEGKATLTNALVGFIIVFVAFWIVQLFGNLLGLTPLLDIF